MDEMFSGIKIRYNVDVPWMVHPHFYSKNIRCLKHTNLSELQKKYYARLYEEAKRLADVVKKNVVDDKTEKVAGELLAYGPYKYLKRR